MGSRLLRDSVPAAFPGSDSSVRRSSMRNAIKWSLAVIALFAVCPRVFLWSMNRRQHMIQDALSAMGTSQAEVAVDPLARTVAFVVAPEVTTVAVTAAALVWTATIG